MKSIIITNTIFAAFALSVISLGLLYIIFTHDQSQLDTVEFENFEEKSNYNYKINELLTRLKILERNNAEMKQILSISNPEKTAAAAIAIQAENSRLDFNSGFNQVLSYNESSDAYESARRALERDIKELWYTIHVRSGSIGAKRMDQIRDLYRTLRSHLIKLRAGDGFETFRKKETDELATVVQNRLHELQNPKNCEHAKKLVCNLNKQCGFGCQIHHLCYCLIVAYATGRTLILESYGWRYNKNGWETVFLPISDTCTTTGSTKREAWAEGRNEDAQLLELPILDFLWNSPPYIPIAIPADIADRLEKVHGEPHIWWVGQFIKYLLRLQPQTELMINKTVSKLGIASPTVGIHVRRTDKIGSEASLHSLKEYMVHAEEYFAILEKVQGKAKRRVFIASDEPKVISKAMNTYLEPDWVIIGDSNVAQVAAVQQRYTDAGLNGILKDVFMLAECDFVVCTFSSQVCRLAYELIQAKHVDASERFVSLDDIYYFGGGNNLIQIAETPHISRDNREIELKVGDKISVAGNHWNGMSKGRNLRTNKIGIYPSYKVRNAIHRVSFPELKWWLAAPSVQD